MGRRGPAPVPSQILKMRGSTLVTKKRERGEVKGPAGTPDCPAWLSAEAKEVWDQLVPQLEAMGVLTRIDGHLLSRYCRLWTRWRKAEAFIDERGDVYPIKDAAGTIKYLAQFPQVSVAAKLAQLLGRMEAELGMSPSARSRIQVQQHGDSGNDAKNRFFQAG